MVKAVAVQVGFSANACRLSKSWYDNDFDSRCFFSRPVAWTLFLLQVIMICLENAFSRLQKIVISDTLVFHI